MGRKNDAYFIILLFCFIGNVSADKTITKVITFDPTTRVEILTTDSNDFLGISRFVIESIDHNSSGKPMLLEIVGRNDKYNVWEKPQPIGYRSKKLRKIVQDESHATIILDLNHPDGSTDELRIILERVRDRFYETPASGVKYHFEWSSPKRFAHQIRETSWWSFGPSVDGLRWISQNSGYGRNSCDFVVERGMTFGGRKPFDKIAWGDVRDQTLQSLKKNPIFFGYLAQKEARETRQGDGDYVTFASRGNISFIRYADEPSMNYWEFERLKNEKVVRFEEWYCTPLKQHIQTAPIISQVLHIGGVNAWITAHEIVQSKLLKAAKMPYHPPVPWVAFTQFDIEDPKELKKQVPYDQALKWLKKIGVKEYWIYGPWKSNWSEVDKMTPEEIERHGLYSHSVWDFDWSYNKINIPALKLFMEQTNAIGVHPAIWTTQTMSQISPQVETHPDWACRRTNGSLYNYIYKDLVGMDHGSGYSDYLANRIALRKQELSFDTLWLDSFFFAADILNWMNPEITPNLTAALKTVAKFRKSGIKRIYNEVNSPFLISSSTGLLDQDSIKNNRNLYLLYNTSPVQHTLWAPETYFKCLAFKSCMQPYLRYYLENPDFVPLASYGNKAYLKALPYMHRCHVLEKDQGTLYWSKDRNKAVVFTFKNGPLDLENNIESAVEILHETPCAFNGSKLQSEAYKVYLVEFN